MSEPLRVAMVSEGITDFIVVGAAIEAILGSRSFDLTLIQPEGSVALLGSGDAGQFGGGWKGVFRWCQQSSQIPLTREILLQTYDLLVLHLDADVGTNQSEGDWPFGLPCNMPCPPANAQTDALRGIVLNWLELGTQPPQMVFCTPSKSTETWMVWLFGDNDSELKRYRQTWECYSTPANRLSQLPRHIRFTKNEAAYRAKSSEITKNWPRLAGALSQAQRFETEFLAVL